VTAFETPAIGSADESQPYHFLDTLAYVRVPGTATGGRHSVVEMHLRAGHAPPMHVHENGDEIIHVTDGQVAVHTADGEQVVDAGNSIVLPRGERHSLVAVEAATILTTTAPAGFDEFVTAVAEPAADATVPDAPPSEAAIGRVNELAPEHDIEIVGPPPAGP
jgi:quercetin dioxygenase-like cupin family protein